MNAVKFGIVFDVKIRKPSDKQKMKDATNKVASESGADKKMISVLANKLPARFYQPIDSIAQKIRNYCGQNSITINDKFVVLPEYWVEFERNYLVMRAEFNLHVDNIVKACENGELDTEMNSLGDFKDKVKSFNCNDLRNAFSISESIDADFSSPYLQPLLARIDNGLKTELSQRIKNDAEREYHQALSDISSFLTIEINHVLNDVIERTSRAESKGIQWKSLVEKVKDLTDKIPQYNILNDSKVSKTIAEIYTKIASFDAPEFKDEKIRTTVNNEAIRIMNEFNNPTVSNNTTPVISPVETDLNIPV